jgi:hypothetical protein
MNARDWFPYLASVISVAIGGVIALVATWLNQRISHRREHEAKRRGTLLDTYADWASLLDYRHDLLASAFWKGRGTEEELAATAAERAALWKEIRALDTRLRAATYKLVFLEQDPSRRTEVQAIHKLSNYWQTEDGWDEFTQLLQGVPDHAPPYAERLAVLVAKLADQGVLR